MHLASSAYNDYSFVSFMKRANLGKSIITTDLVFTNPKKAALLYAPWSTTEWDVTGTTGYGLSIARLNWIPTRAKQKTGQRLAE